MKTTNHPDGISTINAFFTISFSIVVWEIVLNAS
jgi:hypothetical protein